MQWERFARSALECEASLHRFPLAGSSAKATLGRARTPKSRDCGPKHDCGFKPRSKIIALHPSYPRNPWLDEN
jgi:hypothetical protein